MTARVSHGRHRDRSPARATSHTAPMRDPPPRTRPSLPTSRRDTGRVTASPSWWYCPHRWPEPGGGEGNAHSFWMTGTDLLRARGAGRGQPRHRPRGGGRRR
jgi:hypothetical protein